jgi:hypothetical protein
MEVSKMKRMQTIILAAVGAVVLLTALGVGFYIRGARQAKQKSEAVSQGGAEAGEKPQQVGDGNLVPARVRRERFRNLSEEESAKVAEGMKKREERRANMSEEEKEKFRQQLRERFNAERQSRVGLPALSGDDKATLRERWANMSRQERDEFRAEMRERFGDAWQEPNAVQGEPNVVGQEPNAIQQEKK